MNLTKLSQKRMCWPCAKKGRVTPAHNESKLGRQKLKDNNPFGGKGRMTFKLINKLQNYYGLAIRSNKGNLQEMEKAVNASLKRCASSAQNQMHDDCPKGEDSWCGWQRDQATGGR